MLTTSRRRFLLFPPSSLLSISGGDTPDAAYEKLDDELRAELPLKRIWVPVRDEES